MLFRSVRAGGRARGNEHAHLPSTLARRAPGRARVSELAVAAGRRGRHHGLPTSRTAVFARWLAGSRLAEWRCYEGGTAPPMRRFAEERSKESRSAGVKSSRRGRCGGATQRLGSETSSKLAGSSRRGRRDPRLAHFRKESANIPTLWAACMLDGGVSGERAIVQICDHRNHRT